MSHLDRTDHTAAIIVDDTPSNLPIARAIMQECFGDCPLYTADSMTTGLARLREALLRDDLETVYVLSDYQMGPDGSGVDLCDAATALQSGCRCQMKLAVFTLAPDAARADLLAHNHPEIPVIEKTSDLFADAARIGEIFNVGERGAAPAWAAQ